MNVQALFAEETREEQLGRAVKRARSRRGAEFPFAFALLGRGKSVLVLDGRGEFTPEKMLKPTRKLRPQKFAVGTARINGKTLELRVVQQKGSIKPKDVRDFLAKQGLPIRQAVISDGSGVPALEESPPGNGR